MPKLATLSTLKLAQTIKTPAQQKALKTATDFESQVMKSFLEQAYSGLKGDGPMGASGTGSDAWRSLMIEEQAKAVTAKGGIGIAPAVYREIARRMGGQFDAAQ